jgi:hypothetical protein
MKKLTLSLLAAAWLSATGSATAWWGGGWNPYDPWDPRFWMEEFFGGGYYGGYGGPWGYGGGPWGYGGPWNYGSPWGWGGYGYPYHSGYYAAGPWVYGYPNPVATQAPRVAAAPEKTDSSQ